ncbi:MAG TPA: zinc ribbon domain-containing protein [Acidobacteriota bacterium]|nr:zinc ribbon domain-containing protein [Acidobacteriota bacterium]
MPLYEYECRSCKAKFEQLVFNNKTKVSCRKCGSPDITQLLSVFAVAGSSDRAAAEPGPCGTCGAAQRGTCMLQ